MSFFIPFISVDDISVCVTADRLTVLSHVDTLYKTVYISPFNTSLHALMLIYQVMNIRFLMFINLAWLLCMKSTMCAWSCTCVWSSLVPDCPPAWPYAVRREPHTRMSRSCNMWLSICPLHQLISLLNWMLWWMVRWMSLSCYITDSLVILPITIVSLLLMISCTGLSFIWPVHFSRITNQAVQYVISCAYFSRVTSKLISRKCKVLSASRRM